MKKIARVFLILAVICITTSLSLAYEPDDTVTMYSSATGTTGAVTGSEFPFNHPVKDIGCDVYTSPVATVTVKLLGHEGWAPQADARGLVTFTTCSIPTCNFAVTGRPTRVVQPVITMSTNTTAVVTLQCTGMK